LKNGELKDVQIGLSQVSEGHSFVPPSLSFAKDRVAELESVDLAEVSVDDLVGLLRPLLVGFVVQLPSWHAGLNLFRASTRFLSPPSNVVDIWHPPPELCGIDAIGSGTLKVASRTVPLRDVESVWMRPDVSGQRSVIVP
jgi:hypothetical protein